MTSQTEPTASLIITKSFGRFNKGWNLWIILAVFTAVPATIAEIVISSMVTGETDEEIANDIVSFLDNITLLTVGGILGLVILGLFLSVYFSAVHNSTFIKFYNVKNIDIVDALKLGLKNFKPVLVSTLLVGAIVLGGLLLFIIPGIIFALWYSFVIPVVIDQKKRPREALEVSKQLYKTKPSLVWGGILWLILVTIVIEMLVSIIGAIIGGVSPALQLVVTGVLSTAGSLFVGFAFVAIYFQLKRLKAKS